MRALRLLAAGARGEDRLDEQNFKSFDEVLAAHGHGDGCEICKPAVASILASLHNEKVLEGDRAALQDTNDRSLANMQRGGSYSVVPRVPGGEILPEQLIVLGEVAKKYDLYSKITGAQRVDLFGAAKADLPSIWADLGKVGFESGHACGKALRTVKSCVGSSWCRYGRPELRRLCHYGGEPLQGVTIPAQDEVRRVGLHARVRRGPVQRFWNDSYRARV